VEKCATLFSNRFVPLAEKQLKSPFVVVAVIVVAVVVLH